MNDIQENDFNYNLVDDKTAKELKQLDREWDKNISDFFFDAGKMLKQGQEILAGNNQYDGFFQKWYESKGLNKSKVYRLMNYYDLVVSQWEDRERIKELPKKLAYKIAQKSVDSELKEKVLSGEIDTYQEYKEALEEQKQDDDIRSLEESTAIINKNIKKIHNALDDNIEEIEEYAEEKGLDKIKLLKELGLYEVYKNRDMDTILDYLFNKLEE